MDTLKPEVSFKEEIKKEEASDKDKKLKRKSISFKLTAAQDESHADSSSNSSSTKPKDRPQRSKTLKTPAEKEAIFRLNRKKFDSIEVVEFRKFWADHSKEYKEYEHTPDVIRNTKRNSMIGLSNISIKNLSDLSEDSS